MWCITTIPPELSYMRLTACNERTPMGSKRFYPSLPCCSAWRHLWLPWGPAPRRWPTYRRQPAVCASSGEELSSSPHFHLRWGNKYRSKSCRGRKLWGVDKEQHDKMWWKMHSFWVNWQLTWELAAHCEINRKRFVTEAASQNKTSKTMSVGMNESGSSGRALAELVLFIPRPRTEDASGKYHHLCTHLLRVGVIIFFKIPSISTSSVSVKT